MNLGWRQPGSGAHSQVLSRLVESDWQGCLSIWPPSSAGWGGPLLDHMAEGVAGMLTGLAGKQERGGGWAAGEAFPAFQAMERFTSCGKNARSVAVARSEVSPPAWFISKYIVLLLIACLIRSWRFS